MKLHLRDFFWLMFVAAVATLWWIDRSRLASRVDDLENPKVSLIHGGGQYVHPNPGDVDPFK